VDHQHGLVTGFAIDKGVDLVYTPTDDGIVSLRSLTFEGDIDFSVRIPALVKQGNWGDYARGAKFALQKRFTLTRGFKGVIKGSLPVGGLSSSAAVLIAYVMAFAQANNLQIKPFEVMKIASEAEREYIGLNNGLLDQACIALGKKDHLLMLDCESNDYRLIPRNPKMPPFEIGIFFSGLTRNLMNSDYNLRVSECKTAAWDLQAFAGIPIKVMEKTFLRDVPKELFQQYKDRMPARFARRAQHFYEEYKRVREGVTAWETGDLEWFGALSNASCESSIHNYECGSPELIAIYRALCETEGVYGGRFSGAGFKGACIALVDPEKKEAIQQSITEKYLKQFPQYKDSFAVFYVKIDDGARFL
jgi:galactokinase/galacturonokinase